LNPFDDFCYELVESLAIRSVARDVKVYAAPEIAEDVVLDLSHVSQPDVEADCRQSAVKLDSIFQGLNQAMPVVE